MTQKVRISANLHDERSYPTDCTFLSKYNNAKYKFDSTTRQTAWFEGELEFPEYTFTAGTTYTLELAFPWEAQPDQTRDFSVVAWGQQAEVTITHTGGLTSDKWPLQTLGSDDSTPDPKPFSDY